MSLRPSRFPLRQSLKVWLSCAWKLGSRYQKKSQTILAPTPHIVLQCFSLLPSATLTQPHNTVQGIFLTLTCKTSTPAHIPSEPSQLELKLVRHVQNNRMDFSKYIGSKREAKETVSPCLIPQRTWRERTWKWLRYSVHSLPQFSLERFALRPPMSLSLLTEFVGVKHRKTELGSIQAN